jgi:ABC-type multidrug transport system ATPase subunit
MTELSAAVLVGVLGPNGAGKTTVLECLDEPTSGLDVPRACGAARRSA